MAASSSSSSASGNKRRATDDESPLSSSKRLKLSSPASASGGSSRWKYDVFLSFRGEDTQNNFTDHLYAALQRNGICTFRDDERLEKGTEISSELTRAIEESRLSIVIFSKNYASSTWCLEELAKIVECSVETNNNHTIIPVFYNVDPSHVRKQEGEFKKAFDKHQQNPKIDGDKIQKWRAALERAANNVGDFISAGRPDSKLVGEIVETVCTELSKCIPSSSDLEGLIGIHRIKEVISLLRLDMEDVRKIIGIWGMGGVGKTTIARAVFKSISYQFDGACFIEKVGKRLENGGSDCLQLEVLSEVLHEENLKLGTPTIRPFIMELLNQKKVFIVLDDVNNFLQLETLAQGLNRCGLGSRIIITSRNKQVFCNFNIDDHEIYEAKGFSDDEALELFHKHANPTKDCMALSEKIVNYAKGNPLALEVFGLSLKGMSKQVWESALKKLQGIVNSGISDVLKISYDGLNEEEKKLYLDLACFGDLYNYHGLLKEEFLDCLEYSLSGLVAKSLITRHIRTGDTEMHDLLQEMGREIVLRESPNNPGKCSRVWERNDVIRTLEKNTGTDAVEVISLDMDDLEDIHLSSQVFDKMHNLRFLIFHSMYGSDKVLHLPNGLNCLPDELMFLHWLGYPLRTLPLNFKPEKLVKLDLSGSNIEQLWEGTKRAPKLKWLNLSYCEHLTRIPNLLDFPLLVEVDLSHCESLVDFPSSVQQHNNLRNLNISKTAIEEVPSSIQSLINLTELKLAECTRLKHISTSICKLKSLSTLDLTDCSKLEIFPEILETMESLKALKLSAFFKINMDLKVLPPSIEHLNGLQTLQLSFCDNLEMLPSSICNLSSLEELYLYNCSKLDKLPDKLGNLKSLKKLRVSGFAVGQLPSSITCLENLEDLDCSECSLMEIPENIGCLSSLKKLKLSRNMFESLPKSIKQLSKLEFLSLSHCNMLRSLPGFPEGLECLEAMDCDQLCQVPDASEFVRCINSKSQFANYYHRPRVDFIFTNSLNLIKVVSNVFEESLDSLRIMQRTEKGSGKLPNEFSIYLPGNKIPEWFSNQSLESSVNIKVLRNDLVNRKFMGFAICAVFGFDENNTRVRFTLGVDCDFKTYYDHIKICNGNRIYRTHYGSDLPSMFIDSDHMLLGYCSFYSRNPMKLPAGDSDYVDISIEFKIRDKGNQLKCCAVHPIYAKEPIEIISATIQEIEETSGRTSDTDNLDIYGSIILEEGQIPSDSERTKSIMEIISRGDLKEMLCTCAKAIENNDIYAADWLMTELRQMVSVSGEPIQRLGAYMLEGLIARLAASGSFIDKALRCKESVGTDLLTYMHQLYEICPYFKFGYVSAYGAIAEAIKDESRVHIIDFQIAQGTQWNVLIMALAFRPGGPPCLRITGIDDSTSAYARGGGLEVVGKRLSRLAESYKIPFEFNAAAISGSEVRHENLKIRPGEAIAVNFAMMLHHMPDESVSTQNHRDRLLRLAKNLSPKVVTVVEQEANTNTAPFFPRFVETMNHYMAIFDSVDAVLPRENKDRINVEQHCLARDIINIIACEGVERVKRHELLGKWRSRFLMAGFTPYPLSPFMNATIKTLLKNYKEKYTLVERDGVLFLGWKNQAIIVSSAWR